MNSESLMVVASLFSMSLLAAIVLFKWLKNTAIVKLPFGSFGGAVAGFIGVFLILQNSYESFAVQGKRPSIDIPAGYHSFISENYGIGVGYPGELKFDTSQAATVIGVIHIDDLSSNVNIVLVPLRGDETKNLSEDEVRRQILNGSAETVASLFKDVSAVERTSYSLSGLKGGWQRFSWKANNREIITTQIIIPVFKKNSVWTFTLTSEASNLDRDMDVFTNIMSTVKFF